MHSLNSIAIILTEMLEDHKDVQITLMLLDKLNKFSTEKLSTEFLVMKNLSTEFMI